MAAVAAAAAGAELLAGRMELPLRSAPGIGGGLSPPLLSLDISECALRAVPPPLLCLLCRSQAAAPLERCLWRSCRLTREALQERLVPSNKSKGSSLVHCVREGGGRGGWGQADRLPGHQPARHMEPYEE